MKNISDILQQEFVGINAKVERSVNSSLLGISGRVVDETKKMLVIRQENKDKAIAKGVAVFCFTMPDGTVVEIDGRVIMGRPEDRVKRKIRRRW